MMLKKQQGMAGATIIMFFLYFCIAMSIIIICYSQASVISNRIQDDSVASIQGACLFDRHEYATDSQVCFYANASNAIYEIEPDKMLITKRACEYTYEKFKTLLAHNLPRCVQIPTAEDGGISKFIKKFEMINVYYDVAYVYDPINNTESIISPALPLKSIVNIELAVDFDVPLFGARTKAVVEKVFLEQRIF